MVEPSKFGEPYGLTPSTQFSRSEVNNFTSVKIANTIWIPPKISNKFVITLIGNETSRKQQKKG